MAITSAITITIYAISHLFHLLGFCLLIRIRKADTFGAAQRLYLLNLSFVESTYAAVAIIEEIVWQYEDQLSKAKFPVVLILDGFFYVWYILVMMGLTFDRFLTLYLKLRYMTMWQIKKTKLVLTTCLVLSILVFLVLVSTHADVDALSSSMTLYLWPLLNVLFLLIFIVTYGYLARTAINQNNVLVPAVKAPSSVVSGIDDIHTGRPQTAEFSSRKTTVTDNNSSFFSMRKMKRGFIVPSLLITSFIVFWVTPDFVYFGYELSSIQMADDSYVDLLYPLGVLVDAIIYILCWKDTRKELKKIIGKCFKR